jgi:hypothetical protein
VHSRFEEDSHDACSSRIAGYTRYTVASLDKFHEIQVDVDERAANEHARSLAFCKPLHSTLYIDNIHYLYCISFRHLSKPSLGELEGGIMTAISAAFSGEEEVAYESSFCFFSEATMSSPRTAKPCTALGNL